MELAKYGGATALVIALMFLIREVGKVWLMRRNGGGTKSLEERLNKIQTNDISHLSFEIRKLSQEINDLKIDFYVFKQKVLDKLFADRPKKVENDDLK